MKTFTFSPRIYLLSSILISLFLLHFFLCSAVLGMDTLPDERPCCTSNITLPDERPFRTSNITLPEKKVIDIIEDNFQDSASTTFCVKEEMGPEDVQIRRILSLDGGGLRGLFSIIELCVLEEIMNDTMNMEVKTKILGGPHDQYVYIRDVFHVAAGTSTGSIIAAGLFFWNDKIKYSAMDIAKLYTRFGYQIFKKRKIAAGVYQATYGNKGLTGLLNHHFGGHKLSDIDKNIYIVALNETKQEAAIYSNAKSIFDSEGINAFITDAVLHSSSAPTYFPAVKTIINNEQVLISDGGTVANNPAHLTFMKEKRLYKTPFEIYSFGTGVVPSTLERHPNTGLLAVKTIFMNSLTAAEKLAYTNCIDEMCAMTSQLNYFARINPKVEVGKDKLDDTSDSYKEYAVNKAFSVTKGKAFANMVTQLGFTIPQHERLAKIHQKVRDALNMVKSNKYAELDKYEKSFIVKRALNLDLNFICNGECFYQKKHGDEPKQISPHDFGEFLNDLQDDIVARQKKDKSYVSYFWSFIQTNPSDKVNEFLPRCRDFHKVSDGQIALTVPNFYVLINEKCKLTQTQIAKLNAHSGKGLRPKSESKETRSDINNLVFSLFNEFSECCLAQAAKYQYTSHDASCIKLVTVIFWKNAFKNIEGQITKSQILALKEKLYSIVKEQILRDRSSFALTSNFLKSRHWTLVQGLNAYADKFCKE